MANSISPDMQDLPARWAYRRMVRWAAILAMEVAFTALALKCAILLRFDGRVPDPYTDLYAKALPTFIVVRLLAVLVAGLQHWSFRMSGLAEAVRLAGAALAGTLVLYVIFWHVVTPPMPRSAIALELFFTLTFTAAFRFSPRMLSIWYSQQRRVRRAGVRRTIIAGAGGAGDLLLRDLLRSPDHGYHVVGFVDDDPTKKGTYLGGRPVLGSLAEMPQLITKHQVAVVLVAIPHLSAKRIREMLKLCSRLKASFKIIPTSFASRSGLITAAMLHDLSPVDLLPRDQVAFDHDEIQAMVKGRRILVTGGGGSIGGEIARQVTEHDCGLLVLVDMNENDLYLKARQLREQYPKAEVRTEVADIRDAARLCRLGESYHPQYVFHAAAHKHVPLMEDAPEEAIKNNVLGTLNVAQMVDACGAERLIFISTDKAVQPTSVMGATKRVGELIVRDLARRSHTQTTAVRFGNVLGSAGSVVPIFKQQIERGGPVTVTHPECTRYFMTIPEAVGLVLLAGLGGYGDLCILDMGEPIKIADLAAHMITMAGYIPGVEIPIIFSGLRPGEKLHEVLLTEEEEQTQTVRDGIKVAQSRPPQSDLHQRIQELARLAEAGNRDGILRALSKLVPSYRVTPNVLAAPSGGVTVVPFRPGNEARGV